MEPEAAKVPIYTYENGSANDDNHTAEENKLEKSMSILSTISQEYTQEVSERGTQSRSLVNVEDLIVSEEASILCENCANSKLSEADTASQPSEPGPSVWLIDRSSAIRNNAGIVGDPGEGANSGCTEASNGLQQTDEETEFLVKIDPTMPIGCQICPQLVQLHEGPTDVEVLDEFQSLAQPLDVCHDTAVKSYTGFLHHSAEVVVAPAAVDAYPRNNVLDCDFEALGPHTITGANEGKFIDYSGHQLPSQETGIIAVSTDLDGWHRFDAGGNEVNGAIGCEQTIGGVSQQKLELWEQLLEDGLEVNEKHFPISTSQIEAEVGIDSSLHDGNQLWLASPGNPFIEGLDRLSNFSEADGFTINENTTRSQLLHSFEAGHSLPTQEGLSYSDPNSEVILSGVIYDRDKFVEESVSSQSNIICNNGTKRHAQPRFPSFSDIRRSSSKSRDPSFNSFIEQVPAWQGISNTVHGAENSGEKWKADFDLMVPAMHEGPRSLSLPRDAGELQGQGQKQSFSLYSRELPIMASQEEPIASQSKPSGFLSPKLSPMMKKVVNKVRTTPDQVLNAVRQQGKSSNTSDDKKELKKWTWRCCICCSRAH